MGLKLSSKPNLVYESLFFLLVCLKMSFGCTLVNFSSSFVSLPEHWGPLSEHLHFPVIKRTNRLLKEVQQSVPM